MNLEELVSQYDFSDRTVLVTGGAGILGGEIACALVGLNANVVLLDRDGHELHRLAADDPLWHLDICGVPSGVSVEDLGHMIAAHGLESVVTLTGALPQHRVLARLQEASVFAAGFPTDVAASLIVELDGPKAGLAVIATPAPFVHHPTTTSTGKGPFWHSSLSASVSPSIKSITRYWPRSGREKWSVTRGRLGWRSWCSSPASRVNWRWESSVTTRFSLMATGVLNLRSMAR